MSGAAPGNQMDFNTIVTELRYTHDTSLARNVRQLKSLGSDRLVCCFEVESSSDCSLDCKENGVGRRDGRPGATGKAAGATGKAAATGARSSL